MIVGSILINVDKQWVLYVIHLFNKQYIIVNFFTNF